MPVLTLSMRSISAYHTAPASLAGMDKQGCLLSVGTHDFTLELGPRTGQTGRARGKERHSFHIMGSHDPRSTGVYRGHTCWIVRVLLGTHPLPASYVNGVCGRAREASARPKAEKGKSMTVFEFSAAWGKEPPTCIRLWSV